MIKQTILKPILCLVAFTLTACSHTVTFELVGKTEVSKITRAELLGDLVPSDNFTSIEKENSINPEGYIAYYFGTNDKVSKLVETKDMHALFYNVVECMNLDAIIYSDKAYQLLSSQLDIKSDEVEEYFAVYVPKRYPEFFKILNRNSGQSYKESYNDLSAHCVRFTAGAMTGSNLSSNLISLDGK